MTIREIAVAFGFVVDRDSERQAEGSIKKVKNLAVKLLGTIGIGLSIAGISGLAEAAANVEALESQFSQVFGDMEDEAARRLQKVADDADINANRMKGSFSGIAAFAKVSGVEQAQALEIAERAMVAVADSAAYYDRSIEATTESLRSFLKGNYENDAALGLSATETTRNAAANELYKKSFNALSEAEKQFTLLKMVEDANKASGALGQAAREADTWTNQLGNLKQSVTDLQAATGKAFLQPAVMVLKFLISLVQGATKKVQELTGETGSITKAFDRFHALVKRLRPELGRMAETLKNGMQKGIGVVKGIVDKLGGLGNVLKILAVVAGAFLAVMTFAKAVSGIKKLVAALKAADKAMLLGKLKVLAIVAVIAVLALIVEDFVHFLMGNDSVIGTFFDKAGIGADNAREAIINAWNAVTDFLLGVWDFLKQAAGMFADAVSGFFEKHGESIRANFERAWNLVKTYLGGVWKFIGQLAATLFGGTEDSINGSTMSTKDKILAIWQAILTMLSSVWDTLYTFGSAAFNNLATVIETVFGWIQAFWSTWGDLILNLFGVVWNTLISLIQPFLDALLAITDFLANVFTGNWEGAWNALVAFQSAIWDAMIAIFTGAWDIICALWDKFAEMFGGYFTAAYEVVSGKVTEIKEAIVNGLKEAIDWIQALPGQAVQWGMDFIGGLKDGIMAGVSGVVDAVKGVGERIKSFLHFSVPDEGPLTDYESWMPDFMGGLAKGIASNEDVVLERIQSLAGSIRTLMAAASANAATAARGAVSSTTSSVTQNVNIENSYSGGSTETQRNVSKAMRKSATDATEYMARGLAYARG